MDDESLLDAIRAEYDAKPEWFKAIASSLPVTGQLVAMHEYDKAIRAGKTGDAVMAAIGSLPIVGMATKGAVLTKGVKGVAKMLERDSNVIARGASNFGFGVGAGQSAANIANSEDARGLIVSAMGSK